MNGRELYPDAEQRRRIMDFIMAAGQTLLENGAEVFRVEQTMEIMARSFHLRSDGTAGSPQPPGPDGSCGWARCAPR